MLNYVPAGEKSLLFFLFVHGPQEESLCNKTSTEWNNRTVFTRMLYHNLNTFFQCKSYLFPWAENIRITTIEWKHIPVIFVSSKFIVSSTWSCFHLHDPCTDITWLCALVAFHFLLNLPPLTWKSPLLYFALLVIFRRISDPWLEST